MEIVDNLINHFADIVISLVMIPMILVFTPLDLMLTFIPGLTVIPAFIHSLTSYLSGIPDTMVSLTGLNPILWNIVFNAFLLYMFVSPTINLIKLVLHWFKRATP